MSYGKPTEPSRKKAAGGSGLIFLIILALGAMFVFRNFAGGTNSGVEPTGQENRGPLDPFEATGQRDRTDDSGDWSMDEVAIDNRGSIPDQTSPADSKKTTSGDWEMEEVPAKGDKQDFDIKLSDKTSPDAPKSTEKGDWKMEEVPDKKDN